jgi:phasin family protein
MADTEFEAAEKAYAAAAEAVSAKPEIKAEAETKPEPAVEAPAVQFPPKASRTPKAKATTPAPVAAKAKPARKVAAKPAVAKPAPKAKKTKVVAKAKSAAPAKPKTVAKPKVSAKPKTTRKPAAAAKPAVSAQSVFQKLKDKTMDTTQFTTKMKSAVAEVQVKAKEAFDKGAAAFGEYNEFSKGNLEAVVESGKILASGVQSLGSTFVADSKANFETLTAEVKELAAVKSPTDFFKLQAAFVKRNFDLAVAQTSKNSEAVLKLANDAAAPISGRVSLAVEKIKKAA